MSEEVRTDKDRRITELEALVSGMAHHITQLEEMLDERDQRLTKLLLKLNKHRRPPQVC